MDRNCFNRSTLAAVLCILLAACGDSENVEVEEVSSTHKPAPKVQAFLAEPLAVRMSKEDAPLFSKLDSSQTGIAFQNPLDTTHALKRLYQSGFACGGVALGDLDGDGLPEVFFASGPKSNALYKQSKPFVFEDVAGKAGVTGGDAWATGVAFIDIDADQDLDIYVCHYNTPNALYLNEGALSFREAAAEYGLDLMDASLMPSFCDYDNDGDLDCWVLTNRLYREGGRPTEAPITKDASGKLQVKPEYAKHYTLLEKGPSQFALDDVGRADLLMRNDGGKFVDVSDEAGIAVTGFGLSATWWDYDSDGYMDIYVCNDFYDPDRLFKNNGDGSFTDVIAQTVNTTPWFSMGSDAGDLNNDGLLDFVVLDMAATTHYKSKMAMGQMGANRWTIENLQPRQLMRNACYLNTGTARFIETAQLAGIANSDWSWAAKLADFDSDGRVDLFVSNGMARDFTNSDRPLLTTDLTGKTQWDLYEDTPTRPEQNLAFRNRDGLHFDDVSKAWGLDHFGMSYGAAYGDLDSDGDLDLIVANLEEPPSIYQNNSSDHHRVTIRLRSDSSNTYGIGATVRIVTGAGVTHLRQMMPTTGFLSGNMPECLFGLGDDPEIEQLSVTWLSGSVQHFTNLAADTCYVIYESAPSTGTANAQPKPVPLFVASKALQGLAHREQLFEDFDRQPLLPNKLSQLGPGLAWADVNGDGADDVYIGGARGGRRAVLLNAGLDASGVCQFTLPSQTPFSEDAQQENMGALFLDADRDGDLDLYVANGSYEFKVGDALLQDRLYLNDGSGKFAKAKEALPDFRDVSSCVVGADFDQDGDLDLFVGGRVIPGQYPMPAASRLLINQSVRGGQAKFTEAEDAQAPGLRQTGLVTSALWSDADDDGWVDLFVTCEWGPIKFYHNQQGILNERTKEAGLEELLGWWNGIAGADIDQDGDIDYAVANFGLNTKYHASSEKPSLLYYGDYSGNGTKSLVEAKYENDVLLPVRGKSCSTHAMPHLANLFDSYHKFASAALAEIYSPTELEKSLTLRATHLESGLLINDGQGRFSFAPLLGLAQVAPAFGLCFLDANADGHQDLFMAQNFFTPQFETGPYAGGLGVLMLGDGQGQFDALSAENSGLSISGDAKAATLTDFNLDGRPDLALTQNNGPLLTFESTAIGSGRMLRVDLQGLSGNPQAVGARITAHLQSGQQIEHEVYAGGGYLSQSSSMTFVSVGDDVIQRVSVRWPDGQVSEVTEFTGDVLRVAAP